MKYIPIPDIDSSRVDSNIQSIINRKGLCHALEECKAWLENKEEHLRAYSPEDKDERAALRRTIQDLENSIQNYLKS